MLEEMEGVSSARFRFRPLRSEPEVHSVRRRVVKKREAAVRGEHPVGSFA
jgi:hypothetical protein